MLCTEICRQLNNGIYDATLKAIYGKQFPSNRQRYVDAIIKFQQIFGNDQISVFSSPGRSEIGGNHTDHQNGQVLAATIDLDIVAVAGLANGTIHIVSEGHGETIVALDSLDINSEDYGTTKGLVKGVLAGFKEAGLKIGGFNAYLTSNLPVGVGLSSSAAFEVVIGKILSELYNHGGVCSEDIAKIGKFSENVYFGKPCGLMDQLTIALGSMVHIDFKDDYSQSVSKIGVDFDIWGYDLCVINTGHSHAEMIEEYAAVSNEMKAVARILGCANLKPVSIENLLTNQKEIREACGDRAFLRAFHFVQENQRVSKQAEYLRNNKFYSFLECVKNSGDSSYKFLQNVYVPSDICNQSLSVALGVSEVLLGDDGVCRVHGGGFAGTIQTWIKKEKTMEYKKAMDRMFGEGSCRVLSIRKHGTIKVL